MSSSKKHISVPNVQENIYNKTVLENLGLVVTSARTTNLGEPFIYIRIWTVCVKSSVKRLSMGPPCLIALSPHPYWTEQGVQVALSAFGNFTSPLQLKNLWYMFLGFCRYFQTYFETPQFFSSQLHITFLIKNFLGSISGIWCLSLIKDLPPLNPKVTDN